MILENVQPSFRRPTVLNVKSDLLVITNQVVVLKTVRQPAGIIGEREWYKKISTTI